MLSVTTHIARPPTVKKYAQVTMYNHSSRMRDFFAAGSSGSSSREDVMMASSGQGVGGGSS